MGLIEIRGRSERLGNLPGVQAVRTDVGAVRAEQMRGEAARAAGDGARRVGAAVSGLGDTVVKIAAGMMERQSDRDADDAINRYREEMSAHLFGTVGENGERTPGSMEASIGEQGRFRTTGDWLKSEDSFRNGLRERHFGGLSARAREKAMRRITGFELQVQNDWARRAFKVEAEHTRATQIRNVERVNLDVLSLPDDATLEERTAKWEEWHDTQERAMDALGIAGDAERADFRRQNALAVLRKKLERRLGEAETPEAFEALAAGLDERGVSAILDSALTDGRGNALSDRLSDSLKGADIESFRTAALKDVKSARVRAIHEADARRREAEAAVGRDFTERELKLRDMPQELWADAYETMGHDETLRKADPKRAMAYIDAANEMRTAASKAKEKASSDAIKGNEENLARSLATLDLLKMEGSLSQDDANDAQAAIWRKFRALSLGKQLSPSFMRSFETRLSGQLSDQEANAMRKFYQAFGFTTELDKGGEPTATARKDAKKDSANYYAPFEEDGVKLESRKTRVKAADLLTYGDTLLRTLRALGPDMNREGVVEREIARLKTGWMKGELDKNRDATVRSVMDMQRETRTRWETAQPDKRSEEDDGRREDGKPAK